MSTTATSGFSVAAARRRARPSETVPTTSNSGIEILYVVRDEAELVRALNVGATMIGVNNRDLETLLIDPETVGRIVPL